MSRWLALVVLTLPVLLISLDMTVLNVALPALTEDLAPTGAEQLWIVDVYSFVLAGLLVVMGTLGDRVGRRKLLLAGAAAFGVASVLAAFATSPAQLIAARALLGIGGATLMPSTLSLIKTLFPEPGPRRTAVAVWAAAFSGGAAAGPVLGGFLLEHFWWGSVFLVALPVMALLLIAGPLVLPESRDPRPGRFDLVSAGLSLAALLPVVYAAKTLATHGFSTLALGAAVVGIGAGVLFVRRQRRLEHPMLDLALFADRAFSASVVTNVLGVFALVGILLLVPQYLQLVLGLSPLTAAMWLLPGSVAGVAGALLAARLARRARVATLVGSGLALAAAGLAAIAVAPGLAALVVGFVVVALGIGVVETLTNDVILTAAPAARAGAASAISETGYELGGALGTATLGSVAAAVFTSAGTGSDTLGGAVARAATLPAAEGQALLDHAGAAFTSGMRVAALVAVVVLAVAAVQAFVNLRPRTGVNSSSGQYSTREVFSSHAANGANPSTVDS